MGWPLMDGNCINCAVWISSEDQLFNKFTVVDEMNSSKSQDEEIAVLDAILYIYGFSATNLASAYLDERKDGNLSSGTFSETCEYIFKNGLYLCSNCVSVFKKVYVACHQLKKLSNEEALLRKAIKKFSPPLIKIEVDLVDPRYTTENSESEDGANFSNQRSSSKCNLSPEKVECEPEDLFNTFNFEKDNENEQYSDNDIKPESKNAKEKATSSSLLQRRKKLIKKTQNSSKNLGPRSKSRPRKADGKSKLHETDGKREGLPTATVKLTRIDDENEMEGTQNSKRMRKCRLKRMAVVRSQEEELKNQSNSDSDSNVQRKKKRLKAKFLAIAKKSCSKSPEKPKILKCSCGKAFGELEYLRIHEKTHETQEPVTCETCGESFEKNYLLYIHKNQKHSELPNIIFPCKKCDRKFTCRHSLVSHEKRHERDIKRSRLPPVDISKSLFCSCGKPFRNLESLQYHEKTHESLEPVSCDVCGQTFPMSYKMYGHKILEHSEMPHLVFKCDFCEKKFLRIRDRGIHVQQHHSNGRAFICDVCGKSYTCLKYLHKHSLLHKDEGLDKESLKCTECGIYLKHSLSLKKHMIRMHGTQKTFICHLCGKTTKTMTNMRIHMKVHDPNRTSKTKLPTQTAENPTNLLSLYSNTI